MSTKNSPHTYYQKSAAVLRLSRYILTLLFLLFLLTCILVFGKDITADNVRLLAKYITLNNGSHSLYNDEFPITADENSKLFIVNDNLAVVRKNNLSLYDLGGQKLFSYDYAYSSPAGSASSRNIIIHDIDGKEASVFNTFSKIKTFEFSHGVTDAHINDKGVALISKEESLKSALYVYNSDYKQIYKLLSPDKYFGRCELSKSGEYVLYTTAASSEGNFNCSIAINDVSKNTTEPIYVSRFTNEFPVEIGYSHDGDSIYAITDSSVYFFDVHLKPVKTYKFNQSKVESFFIDNDTIILTEKNNLAGNSMSLIAFSAGGKELFNINLSDKITDIAIGKNKIFALGWENIFEISNSDNSYSVTNSIVINERYNAIACDSKDNCYVATNTKFKRIDFTTAKENTK